jgi:hypothetical protein
VKHRERRAVPKAVLTWAQVDQIRQLYGGNHMNMPTLAERYKVHISTIDLIIRGETWPDENYVPPQSRKATLTRELAHEIRKQFTGGGITMTSLAETHNVTPGTISRIISNQIWYDPEYTPPVRQQCST